MKRFVVTTNNQNRFETAEKRFMLAEFLARLMEINLNNLQMFNLPHAQETGGTHRFVVDMENEWCLSFDEDEANVFWIEHKEDNMVALEAVTTWLVYRYCEGSKIEVIHV